MGGSGRSTSNIFNPTSSANNIHSTFTANSVEIGSIGGAGSSTALINEIRESSTNSNVYNQIGVTGLINNIHTGDMIAISYQQIRWLKDNDKYYVDPSSSK